MSRRQWSLRTVGKFMSVVKFVLVAPLVSQKSFCVRFRGRLQVLLVRASSLADLLCAWRPMLKIQSLTRLVW